MKPPTLHSKKGKAAAGVAVGLAAWLLVAAASLTGLLEPFELKLYDRLSRLHARDLRAPEDIALVVVDQESLDAAAAQGINWPWPRQLYAPIVEYCAQGGARAVVFDVLFTEASAYGVEDDQILAAACARSGTVVFPLFLSRNQRQEVPWLDEILPLSEVAGPPPPKSPYRSALPPIEPLARAAAALGNVEVAPDMDGTYRRLPPLFPFGGRWLPSLGLAALKALGTSVSRGEAALTVDGRRFPLGANGDFLLTFYGGSPDFRRYPAINVIQSYVASQQQEKPLYPPDIFAGKVVFVGLTASGLYDLKPTPLRSVYPGVGVHATLVANLLEGRTRQRASRTINLGTGAAAAAVVGAAVLLIPAGWQLGLAMLSCLAVASLAVGLAFFRGLWLDGVGLGSSAFAAFALAATFSYATEGRQRRQIKRMFSHYMSDVLIQDLLKNPDKLRLGGEKRVLTVFFSDLAGFTTLSEKLTPEEVVSLLNRYLTAMTDIILASGGLIDKYEGDAIMAFWGAPVPQEDHAARACLAALDNQQRLAELRQEFQQDGLPPIYSRIGINTGEMIIGNMGSNQRFDFTVMGDSVNLASRLEGAGKAYGVSIIISEETYRQAATQVEVRELDLLAVKGKEVPVRIYELLARKGELDDRMQQVGELFAQGLELYRRQRWQEAMACFQRCLQLHPEDGPSQVFLDRCRHYQESPPPADWDGVFRLTTK